MEHDVMNSFTTNLQGKYFCEDPEMGFTEDQVEECSKNISVFMPLALKFAGNSILMVFPEDICNAWYDGIC